MLAEENAQLYKSHTKRLSKLHDQYINQLNMMDHVKGWMVVTVRKLSHRNEFLLLSFYDILQILLRNSGRSIFIFHIIIL